MSIVDGTWLGPYQVLAELGSGGMGVVYRARDSRLDRQVAVKLLPPEATRDDAAKKRFLQEARAASALDHVNICTIHEIDETEDGRLYLVMAYYEGETLKERIARGFVPPHEAIELVSQAARGLAAAHAQGVVHRDIKPANILVTAIGVVKVLDFGVAKLRGTSDVTQTGQVVGTMAYMSPEQASGRDVDHRTDIWSLGLVLSELLTGRRASGAHDAVEFLRQLDSSPPSWRRDASVLLALEGVLTRALAERREDRFQSAAELGRALGDATPTGAGSSDAGSATAARRLVPSIAVLPFADMSPEKDQDYFCEGMAEELINALGGLEGLRVAARTSAFQFKNQAVDVAEIGRQLRVGVVLEGSVRKAGTRLRITAQLVNVHDGYRIWSERYDRNLDDVFAVQDEIARSVAERLRLELLGEGSGTLVRRHTDNLEAYHAFLRGRHCRFSLYDLRGAIAFFEQAVGLDPAYAPAHAALADCFNILGLYAVLPPGAAHARAKAAAERALELDETLAEAHAAVAQMRFLFEWRWNDAERSFRRALELKPSGIEPHCWYGYFLGVMGRAEEGLAEVSVATEIDPLSAYGASYTASILYVNGRHAESIRQARRALELQPGFTFALNCLTLCCAADGRHDEAVAYAEQWVALSNRTTNSVGTWGMALGFAGRHDEARAALDELDTRARDAYVSPLWPAGILTGLGEIDRACDELERAFDERTPLLFSIRNAHYDALRGSRRYEDLVARMAFPVDDTTQATKRR